MPANVGTMLSHCIRPWPNIVPTLAERFVLAHLCLRVQWGGDTVIFVYMTPDEEKVGQILDIPSCETINYTTYSL